jgi:hypothetical protein
MQVNLVLLMAVASFHPASLVAEAIRKRWLTDTGSRIVMSRTAAAPNGDHGPRSGRGTNRSPGPGRFSQSRHAVA